MYSSLFYYISRIVFNQGKYVKYNVEMKSDWIIQMM